MSGVPTWIVVANVQRRVRSRSVSPIRFVPAITTEPLIGLPALCASVDPVRDVGKELEPGVVPRLPARTAVRIGADLIEDLGAGRVAADTDPHRRQGERRTFRAVDERHGPAPGDPREGHLVCGDDVARPAVVDRSGLRRPNGLRARSGYGSDRQSERSHASPHPHPHDRAP